MNNFLISSCMVGLLLGAISYCQASSTETNSIPALRAEIDRLKKENNSLRKLLEENNIQFTGASVINPPSRPSALTQEQAKRAEQLLENFEKREDSVEEITWYTPKVKFGMIEYGTRAYLYIGKKKTGEIWLRLQLRYCGDDWLFVRSFKVKTDQDLHPLLPISEIRRDHTGRSVWETYDALASSHRDVINKIIKADRVTLRFEGDRQKEDWEISTLKRHDFADVILVFRYLGGEWAP